jgi:hypothetical protein
MAALPKDFRKALVFGLAGLGGALVGELVSEIVSLKPRTFAGVIGQSATWSALFTLGIGLALIFAQNLYLKRGLLRVRQLILAIPGMFIAGGLAGAIAQAVYSFALHVLGTRGVESALAMLIRIFAWALAGGLLAFGMSFFIPNLKRLRALLGGALGGALGAVSFLIVIRGLGFGALTGRLAGVPLLGFFIGVMVALVEAVFREAWLEIRYGPKEIRTVTLGREAVSIGSNQSACTVYALNAPPIAYRYWMQDNAVLCEDVRAGRTNNVTTGDRKQIGGIEVVVCGVIGTGVIAPAAAAVQGQWQSAQAAKRAFTLRLSNGKSIDLPNGATLNTNDLPGLHSVPPGGTVATVRPHPTDPNIHGLQNLSQLSWRVYLPEGDSIEVKPGKSVRLAPGTRVDFRTIQGEIRA